MPADLRSEPSFRRYRRALSRVLSRPPPPQGERQRGGEIDREREGRVVLLIAPNHAFRPRTPRLRSRQPSLAPSRLPRLPPPPPVLLSLSEPGCRQPGGTVVRCTLDAPPPRSPRRILNAARRSYEIQPSPLLLRVLHRRADRSGTTRSLRHAVRSVTSILDRPVVHHCRTVGDLGEFSGLRGRSKMPVDGKLSERKWRVYSVFFSVCQCVSLCMQA
jgi:hypothetical protein